MTRGVDVDVDVGFCVLCFVVSTKFVVFGLFWFWFCCLLYDNTTKQKPASVFICTPAHWNISEYDQKPAGKLPNQQTALAILILSPGLLLATYIVQFMKTNKAK